MSDENYPTEMRTMIDGVREVLDINNDIDAVYFIRKSVHEAVNNAVVDKMKASKLREIETVFGKLGSWPTQGSIQAKAPKR